MLGLCYVQCVYVRISLRRPWLVSGLSLTNACACTVRFVLSFVWMNAGEKSSIRLLHNCSFYMGRGVPLSAYTLKHVFGLRFYVCVCVCELKFASCGNWDIRGPWSENWHIYTYISAHIRIESQHLFILILKLMKNIIFLLLMMNLFFIQMIVKN